MQLHTLILKNNDCYKAGKTIKVKGLMLHSTGANNPKLSRYVGPDDGILGKNPNNNHWNMSGISKCVHGFIGKDKNGDIRTYQTLPWNHRGWHAGGAANNTHIGVEICEAGLDDAGYFKEVYQEAVELFAYLCASYNLTEEDIIDHSEGHALGIASNHGDVKHWFKRHGKSMHTFRADVKRLLGRAETAATVATPKPTTPTQPKVNIDQLARDVISGKYGNGDARRKALGSNYDAVQKRVTELLQSSKPAEKTISQLAREVIAGKHGTGRERMISLGAKYAAVQQEVTRLMRGK